LIDLTHINNSNRYNSLEYYRHVTRSGRIRTVFQRVSQYSIRQFWNNDENKLSSTRLAGARFRTDRYSGKWGVHNWGKSYNKVTSYLVRAKIRNFISRWEALELDARHRWAHASWLIEYALRRLIPVLRGNLFRKLSHTFPPVTVYFRCIIRENKCFPGTQAFSSARIRSRAE